MKILNLDKLPVNTTAKIHNVECNEVLRRRLLDLGLIRGTKITPIFKSPLGDPIAYKVRSSTIALRKEDIKNITCFLE